MIALRDRWTPTSRLFSRVDEGQPRKFVLDCGISWQNYLDGNNVFREINLTPQPSDIAGFNWMVPGLPFKPYLAMNGARRIFVDRNSQAKRIDFPASKFLANKTFTKVGNSLVWQSNAYDIAMRWENSRVKFDVVVKRNIPFDQVQFDVDKTGLTDAELMSFMSNLTATDSSPIPIVRLLSVSLVGGVLTIGFDLTGMTLPVTIDPTLDLQVGASTDDTRVTVNSPSSPPHTFANIFNTNTNFLVGELGAIYNINGSGARFLNVTIGNGATIDVAYLTLTASLDGSSTVVRTDIYGEDADDAAAYSTVADYNGRAKTAAVVWDGIGSWVLDTEYNTPSLVTPAQTIVNRAGWVSGNDMGWKWEDGGSDDEAFRRAYSYDGSTTKAPKLHIEYTAGGADAVPQAWAQYRARRV